MSSLILSALRSNSIVPPLDSMMSKTTLLLTMKNGVAGRKAHPSDIPVKNYSNKSIPDASYDNPDSTLAPYYVADTPWGTGVSIQSKDNGTTETGAHFIYWNETVRYNRVNTHSYSPMGAPIWTIEFWARCTVSGESPTVFFSRNLVTRITPTGLYWEWSNQTSMGGNVNPPANFDYTQWHHYSLTRRANDAIIHIDGKYITTTGLAGGGGDTGWYSSSPVHLFDNANNCRLAGLRVTMSANRYPLASNYVIPVEQFPSHI
jgi:hypothetical protein